MYIINIYETRNKGKLMKHKKQAHEQIEQTIKWNKDRGLTPESLNLKLEVDMLQEELDEFKEAIIQDDKVAMFDALLDLKFVLTGTMYKLGINAEMQIDGYEAVLEANKAKLDTKLSTGKIAKSESFKGPEPILKRILERN